MKKKYIIIGGLCLGVTLLVFLMVGNFSMTGNVISEDFNYSEGNQTNITKNKDCITIVIDGKNKIACRIASNVSINPNTIKNLIGNISN